MIRITAFLSACLLCMSAAAQTPTEATLLQAFRKISYWQTDPQARNQESAYDSVAAANAHFRELMLRFARSPESLDKRLDALANEGLGIVTAEDGNLRIFSWDDGSGGTMRFYDAIYQYRSNKSVAAELAVHPELEPGRDFEELYLLPAAGRKLYLAFYHVKGSTKDMVDGAMGFELKHGKLNTGATIFRTGSGLRKEISFYYDFFSVVDRPERPIRMLEWNAKSKLLSFPVVNAKGQVSNKRIRYSWNGTVFTRMR